MTHSKNEMKTYFHTQNNFQLLFKPVVIDSTTDIVLACLVTCAVTMLYEGLRCLRVNIAQHHRATSGDMRMTSKTHMLQTALYFTELMLAYFLMLAAMTYNIWLFLAVPLGALIGFQLCSIFSRSHFAKPSSANADVLTGDNYDCKEAAKKKTSSSGQTGLMDGLQLGKEVSGKQYTLENSCQDSVYHPDEITELMTSI